MTVSLENDGDAIEEVMLRLPGGQRIDLPRLEPGALLIDLREFELAVDEVKLPPIEAAWTTASGERVSRSLELTAGVELPPGSFDLRVTLAGVRASLLPIPRRAG